MCVGGFERASGQLRPRIFSSSPSSSWGKNQDAGEIVRGRAQLCDRPKLCDPDRALKARRRAACVPVPWKQVGGVCQASLPGLTGVRAMVLLHPPHLSDAHAVVVRVSDALAGPHPLCPCLLPLTTCHSLEVPSHAELLMLTCRMRTL